MQKVNKPNAAACDLTSALLDVGTISRVWNVVNVYEPDGFPTQELRSAIAVYCQSDPSTIIPHFREIRGGWGEKYVTAATRIKIKLERVATKPSLS